MNDQNLYRNFGLLFSGIIVGGLGLMLPLFQNRPLPLEPFVVGLGFLSFALFLPRYLKPIYEAWMQLGEYLGWLNSRILLGIVFFGLIFPMGFLKRLWNDPLSRQIDKKAKTYRRFSQESLPQQMEHPY